MENKEIKTERIAAAIEMLKAAWQILKEEIDPLSIHISDWKPIISLPLTNHEVIYQLPGRLAVTLREDDGHETRWELHKVFNGFTFYTLASEEEITAK